MNLQKFKSLSAPEDDFSPEILALWYDAKGDWNQAHDQVDQLSGQSAARVHAYLHRKEGDLWNADYWYRRAGESRPTCTLEQEWEDLVIRFLKNL
ncbi:MAG: hypothetical protein B7Z16_11425 [Algoriphagus sp. 32-45-6]|jgi:hypothetical protein|nr:MAG: hypothetical protein B7Z16_11425 [Algoriphagus sp. 32-45-6]